MTPPAALATIAARLTDHLDVNPFLARLTAADIVNDLTNEGWTITTHDARPVAPRARESERLPDPTPEDHPYHDPNAPHRPAQGDQAAVLLRLDVLLDRAERGVLLPAEAALLRAHLTNTPRAPAA
ncbi:hypothetical protein ACIQU6_43305 [Streptomyces sp. NPDC090442]|uniref:hypothetical protein n=1 Tax=Streptomyces sp. NPDC090442 TaxID=3365962 RepID=UPI0037F2D387